MYDTWAPSNGFPGTRYNCSESGWIDRTIFYDWFSAMFLPAVATVKRPIFLLLDGHFSHLSTRVVKLAMQNEIHIECLPPHTTTILQPLDVVTLTKVKTAWRQILSQHNRKTNSAIIDNYTFALLVSVKSFLNF
jgi:hypothetical protein